MDDPVKLDFVIYVHVLLKIDKNITKHLVVRFLVEPQASAVLEEGFELWWYLVLAELLGRDRFLNFENIYLVLSLGLFVLDLFLVCIRVLVIDGDYVWLRNVPG